VLITFTIRSAPVPKGLIHINSHLVNANFTGDSFSGSACFGAVSAFINATQDQATVEQCEATPPDRHLLTIAAPALGLRERTADTCWLGSWHDSQGCADTTSHENCTESRKN
jgi:hypothetical protein